MKLKNILLVTDNLEKSVSFYKELFGLKVINDNGENIIMTEGLCLQERRIWESFTGDCVAYGGNDTQLYFEENDLDGFQKKLDECPFEIAYANRLITYPWGQQAIRIYDPDHHVIEIRESMDFVRKRTDIPKN